MKTIDDKFFSDLWDELFNLIQNNEDDSRVFMAYTDILQLFHRSYERGYTEGVEHERREREMAD